jgi:hypothetical protein
MCREERRDGLDRQATGFRGLRADEYECAQYASRVYRPGGSAARTRLSSGPPAADVAAERHTAALASGTRRSCGNGGTAAAARSGSIQQRGMCAHGESAQSLCRGQLPAEVFGRIGIE